MIVEEFLYTVMKGTQGVDQQVLKMCVFGVKKGTHQKVYHTHTQTNKIRVRVRHSLSLKTHPHTHRNQQISNETLAVGGETFHIPGKRTPNTSL